MLFCVPVKARPVCPCDPRLPNSRHDPPDSSVRSHIFQQVNEATRFDDATKFSKRRHLEIIGQDAKQKGRNRRVERSGRKLKVRNIHLVEPTARCNSWASAMRSLKHCRASVDPRNDRIGRVEGTVPPCPNTRIEQSTAQVLKHHWAQRLISSALERQVKQIVQRSDPLIPIEIGDHQTAVPEE